VPSGVNSAQESPWLEALKGVEEGANEGEKGRTNAVLSSVDESSKFVVRRGVKTPKPGGSETEQGVYWGAKSMPTGAKSCRHEESVGTGTKSHLGVDSCLG
jgi:hypothetical protein